MERLRKLRECNKRNMTFKQAFCQFGITKENQAIKKLNEDEEFGAVVNWALNKLPQFHHMNLRYTVNDELYQTTLTRSAREIRVGKPMLQTKFRGAIRYDWPEETTYETLDVETIAASASRADIINDAKINGRLLSAQEVAEQENSHTNQDCKELILTEEERNIVGEFLNV